MLNQTDLSGQVLKPESEENAISELYQMESQPEEDIRIRIDLPLSQIEEED